MRLISFSDSGAPNSALFMNQPLLNQENLIELKRCLFVHEWSQGKLQKALNSLFASKIYSRATRNCSSGDLNVPLVNTLSYGNRSIRYAGPVAFNKMLAMNVPITASKSLLKRYITSFLTEILILQCSTIT